MATTAHKMSRFELAPPRRFMFPALLLLLSERPGHGYGLVPELQALGFGHVDRPAVYRALAQLEGDGLVEVSPPSAMAGRARRIYLLTDAGGRALRQWMGVIKQEHDHLGQVLRRYQAIATTDSVLAEVEGGWALTLGVYPSPVSSSSGGRRRLVSVDELLDGPAADACAGWVATEPAVVRSFRLVPDRSAVLVEVRSTVGPLSFGVIGIGGSIRAAVVTGVVRTDIAPSARLEIDVSRLSSGRALYDAELLRRIDARRYPTAAVDLQECTVSGPGARYRLVGELTFHGVTRPVTGTVRVKAVSDSHLVITGEQVFDVRDFAVTSPTVLMFRIYPDVRVRLQAEAELEVPG
ncbi:MAG: helix-turn-helix transcriptional regulator [Acidimicrobiales bacterium]